MNFVPRESHFVQTGEGYAKVWEDVVGGSEDVGRTGVFNYQLSHLDS